MTFNEEEDEDTLVGEEPIERARCFTGIHVTVRLTKETFMINCSRVRRVLTWAMSKWTKHVVTFNEEEDEDALVEEGPQI